jgi:hypothetical protein
MKPATSKTMAALSVALVSVPLLGIVPSDLIEHDQYNDDGQPTLIHKTSSAIDKFAKKAKSWVNESANSACTSYTCRDAFSTAGEMTEGLLNSNITLTKAFAGWALGGLFGFAASSAADKRKGQKKADVAASTEDMMDTIADTAKVTFPLMIANDILDDGKLNRSDSMTTAVALFYTATIAAIPYYYAGSAVYKNFIEPNTKDPAEAGTFAPKLG